MNYRKEIRKEITPLKYIEKLYGKILFVLQVDKNNLEFLKYKELIKSFKV